MLLIQLIILIYLRNGKIRLLWVMSGILYAVSGSELYQISTNRTAQFLGNIGSNSGPITASDNGSQLVIINNGQGFVYSTSTHASLGPPGRGLQENVLVGSIGS